MASRKLYLRPVGLLYGAVAEAAIADGLALPLAGGPIAFAAAELLEGEPGRAKRRLCTAQALAQSDDAELAALLDKVCGPSALRPAPAAADRPADSAVNPSRARCPSALHTPCWWR